MTDEFDINELGFPGDLIGNAGINHVKLYSVFTGDSAGLSIGVENEIPGSDELPVAILVSVIHDPDDRKSPWCFLVSPVSAGWSWLSVNRFEVLEAIRYA
jgi:hypothetical protein